MEKKSHQYPFDLIDLIFMLAAPYHFMLIVLCIIQWALRHNAGLWQAVLEIANEVNRPIATEFDVISVAIIPALDNVTIPKPKQPLALPPPKPTKSLPSPQQQTRQQTQLHYTPIASSAINRASVLDSISLDTPVESDATKELFNRLNSASHLAIVGETKSGKSTLLCYLVNSYLARGEEVIVIDPHGSPGKWPEGATVIGKARDYPAIANALNKLSRLMQSRYNEIASGKIKECQHPKIHVIADEWRAIKNNIKEAGETLGELITEARKTNIRIILGAHSHYLRGLGVDDSATRESLTIAFLRMDKNENRSIMIEEDTYPLPNIAIPTPHDDSTAIQAKLPNFSFHTATQEKILAYIKKRDDWTTPREVAQNVRGIDAGEARANLDQLCEDGTLQKRTINRAERYGMPDWDSVDDVDVDSKIA